MRWKLPDGSYADGFVASDPGYVLEDDAEIRDVPKGAVYVEGEGAPRVVVRTGMKDERGKINLPVVDFVTEELAFLRDEVIPKLVPYVHKPGKRP